MKWIPLESNIDVMNSYSRALGGLPTDGNDDDAGKEERGAAFYDVYGTEPELLAMVPGPRRAVLLLFPTGGPVDKVAADEGVVLDEKDTTADGDDEIFWMPQTIGNACGTMALLHALLNASLPLTPSSPLSLFLAQALPLSPPARSALLASSPLLADAHVDASSAGQALLRDEDAETDLHFTAFVERRVNGRAHLVELNGNRNGPVDHGVLTTGDLLVDAARFIKEHYIAADPTNIRFNMMALGGPPAEDDDD